MADTPKPKLGTEIATTGDGKDITRDFAGDLLPPSDPVLKMRGAGDLQIYEQILTDPEVGTAWQQRRLAVTSREWEVLPGGDSAADQAAADFLREQLQHIGWDRVTDKMLAGVFYGYAVSELLYARDGQRIVLDAIKVRNRRRFRFAPNGELRLLTRNEMRKGVPAPAPYFWHFANGADHDDEPYGLGIAHWLYWPVLFKRNGLKFWLIFLDKFAMPTGVGKFDDGAKEDDRDRLIQALQAIQTDSGIAIPKSMQIELLEVARSGTPDYKTLHDAMNDTIAKVVLGQTASTQGTPGKLGNEDLQELVRRDLVKADADLVCESFNLGPARWLTAWNFPTAQPPRVWRVIEDAEDTDKRSQVDERLDRMGFRPTLDYVRDTYGGDWEDHGRPAPGVQFAENEDTPEPAEQIAERMHLEARPAIADWMDQLERIVARVAADGLSPDQAKARLMAAFSELPDDQFAEAMAQGMIAAEAAGRADIEDESA